MMKAHWLSRSCLWSEGQAAPRISCMKQGGRRNGLACSLEVQGLDHWHHQPCSTAEPFGQRHILQELSLLPEETNHTIISPYLILLTGGLLSWVTAAQPSVKCETLSDDQEATQSLGAGKPSIHIRFPTCYHLGRKDPREINTFTNTSLRGCKTICGKCWPWRVWVIGHPLPSAGQ